MIARFVEVGRGKVTWEQDYPTPPTAGELETAVRKKSVLVSRDIEVALDGNEGAIFAGFHQVGRIEIKAHAEKGGAR